MTLSKRDRARTALLTTLEVRAEADAMPAGVCGRVVGVALVYNVRDTYGTAFVPGCLDRTKREKLTAGKIALFADHDYQTRSHVGVVRSLETVGDSEVMTADIFDTEDGRALKEYLVAVTASNAHTGLSIGFFDRASDWRDGPADGDRTLYYTEVELEEVSATPRNAVPGADVLAVRREDLQKDTADVRVTALRALISAVGIETVQQIIAECAGRSTTSNADEPEDSPTATTTVVPGNAEDADSDVTHATMDERTRAVRAAYATLPPR
jgi:HK97 family phage prohead protease